jgi:hypothetical protein
MSLDHEEFARARYQEHLREAEHYRLAQECREFESRLPFYRSVLFALGRWMKQTGECMIRRSGRGETRAERDRNTHQQEAHAHH